MSASSSSTRSASLYGLVRIGEASLRLRFVVASPTGRPCRAGAGRGTKVEAMVNHVVWTWWTELPLVHLEVSRTAILQRGVWSGKREVGPY